MNFEKCELPESAFYKKTKAYAFLTAFIESGAESARVTDWKGNYINISSLQSSLNGATKRYNFPQIKTKVINGELYLINTSLLPKEESAS